MIRIEYRIRIYRPVAEVFAFAGNPTNDVHWTGSVLDVAQVTPGPVGVGTEFRTDSKFLAVRTTGTSRVITYEVPHRIRLEGTGDGEAQGWEERTFTSEGGDTYFTRTAEVEVGRMFRLAEPLVASAARRQVETDMTLLKTLMDARAEPNAQP